MALLARARQSATAPGKSGTLSSDRHSRGIRDMFPNQDPPAGWPKPRRSATRVLSVVGFGLMALTTAAVAVSAIVTGDITHALIFAVGAVLFAHLVGLSVSTLRKPGPATHQPSPGLTDQGESGLAFLYSRWAYYWLSSVLVAVVLISAGFVVAFVE